MKDSIESDWIGTVNRWYRRWSTGEVVNGDSTAHLSSSSGADVDSAIGVLAKDKSTEKNLCLVMVNDGGETRIGDENVEGLEKVLTDGGRGFT